MAYNELGHYIDPIQQQMAVSAAIRQTSRKEGFIPSVDPNLSPNELFNSVRSQANAHNAVSLTRYRKQEQTSNSSPNDTDNVSPVWIPGDGTGYSLLDDIGERRYPLRGEYEHKKSKETQTPIEAIYQNLPFWLRLDNLFKFNILLSTPLIIVESIYSILVLGCRGWYIRPRILRVLVLVIGMTTGIRDFTGYRVPMLDPMVHSVEMMTYKNAKQLDKLPDVIEIPIKLSFGAISIATRIPNVVAWSLTNFDKNYHTTTARYAFNNRDKTPEGRAYWKFDMEDKNWIDTRFNRK